MRILGIHQEADSSLCTLEGPIEERGHELHHWHPWRGERRPDLDSYDAVIAMGGIVHPDQHEQYPWLTAELDVLRTLARDGVPVLGVCLGAQLLAHALGAEVARLPEHEVGWYEVVTTPAARHDALLGEFPERLQAFQWHEYGFTPPPGATVLAASPRTPHQAVRLAERAWAVQFHIEVDASVIARWLVEGARELADKGIAAADVEADTRRHVEAYTALARSLAHGFLQVAEGAAQERAA